MIHHSSRKDLRPNGRQRPCRRSSALGRRCPAPRHGVGPRHSISEVDGPTAQHRGRPPFEDLESRALRGWRSMEGPTQDSMVRLRTIKRRRGFRRKSGTEWLVPLLQLWRCAVMLSARYDRTRASFIGNYALLLQRLSRTKNISFVSGIGINLCYAETATWRHGGQGPRLRFG